LSSPRFVAYGLKSLERCHDLFPNALAAGRWGKPAMAQFTERAHNVLNFCQGYSVLLLYLCNPSLKALARFVDVGVDRL
jgi:hypothetical protein